MKDIIRTCNPNTIFTKFTFNKNILKEFEGLYREKPFSIVT